MILKIKAPVFVLLQAGMVVAAMLFDNDDAKKYSWVIYFIQALSFIVVTLNRRSFLLFLSPASLLSLYVSISFFLGGLAFSSGLVLKGVSYVDYLNWRHADGATIFFVLLGAVLMVNEYFAQPRLMSMLRLGDLKDGIWGRQVSILQAAFALAMLLFFIVIPLPLDQFGGSGNVAIVPVTVASIVLIHFAIQRFGGWRFLLYCGLLFVLSAISYSNKREAIFLILPIVMMEAMAGNVKINIRATFFLLLAGALLISLVLVMTIQRGQGGYVMVGAGFWEAARYVPEYVRSDKFLEYFFLNIETSYTYFHSMQAVEYVMSDFGLLAWGATIVKPLFLLLPTSLFGPVKPSSFTNSYTLLYDPGFRSIGGSWVPNLYAEMFWNFWFFGVFSGLSIVCALRVAFAALLKRIQSKKLVYSYGWIYAYMNLLFYFRGSGLDLYMFYVALGMIFGWLFSISGRIRLGGR